MNAQIAFSKCRPSARVTWNGKTVRTSVWKSPVTGRRVVRKLDIDGDAQADLVGHGGSTAPFSSTRWILTITGSAFWAATVLLSASSEKTSPSRDFLTTRCASATDVLQRAGRQGGYHAFRRFRFVVLRKAGVPDDHIKLWLGHSQNLIDLYAAQLRYDETYRRGWCERAGLGFELGELGGANSPVTRRVNLS
jgi:hypothetical protein